MKKTLFGKITSDKMNQTAVVEVTSWHSSKPIDKKVRRTTKYLAHNPDNDFKIGQVVTIIETRPISKRKSWQIIGEVDQKNNKIS
jgi:small subunit ribosomal protein S17